MSLGESEREWAILSWTEKVCMNLKEFLSESGCELVNLCNSVDTKRIRVNLIEIE